MRIEQTTIREILARTDIGGFIGTYVALRKRGNDLVGLCPFHGEKTPSFHVHPDRGFFKCFGCGAGGDVIAFVQQLENVTFPDAARMLAKRAGIELEAESPATARARNEKEAIYAANALAAAFFAQTLASAPEAEVARAYVARRGLSAATVASFKLGYAPAEWGALVRELEKHGVDPALAASAGLVKAGQRGYYDFYRGRLMIPTYATTGEVVAFGGRALDDSEPKYLNTATTPVYVKGRGLFALERARRAVAERGALIVVEGYLDCIALHQAGFTNAVAALGTAFTPEQAAELRKYAERVYVCYDADAAGLAAAVKAVDALASAGCTTWVVQMPPGEDPDSFVRARGAAAFEERLGAAVEAVQLKIDLDTPHVDAKRLTRLDAARRAEASVRRHAAPEEWDRWRVYAAKRLGLDVDDLRRSRFVADPGSFAPRGGAFTRHVAPAAEPVGLERDVLIVLLDEPALVAEYADLIPRALFADDRLGRIFEVLAAHRHDLTRVTDVLAAFGDDRDMVDEVIALQRLDRSSRVRFGDSAARRTHLDRILERFAEVEDGRRKRELGAAIDRLLEAGLPVPQAERDEFERLVGKLERSARKRLGAR